MLGTLSSIGLSRSLTVARAAARRDRDGASSVCLVRLVLAILTVRCAGKVLTTTGPDAEGGITGVMTGGGSAGILAALPMPLGSLTEPLSSAAHSPAPEEYRSRRHPAQAIVRARPAEPAPQGSRMPPCRSSIRAGELKQAACASSIGYPLRTCHIASAEMEAEEFGS